MKLRKRCLISLTSLIIAYNNMLPLYVNAVEVTDIADNINSSVTYDSDILTVDDTSNVTEYDVTSASTIDSVATSITTTITEPIITTTDNYFERENEYNHDYIPGLDREDVEVAERVVASTPQYPQGWKNWRRSNELWCNLPLGSSTVGVIGSLAVTMSKLLVQANAIPDPNFTPYEYCTWLNSANIINSENIVSNLNELLNYKPSDYSGTDDYLLNDITFMGSININAEVPSHLTNTGDNSADIPEVDKFTNTEEAISIINRYRTNNYCVILKLSNNEYVLVGNKTSVNGKDDYEIYSSSSVDVNYVSEYSDDVIKRIDLYHCTKTIAGNAESILSNASNMYKESGIGSSESIYTISNYEQSQKEVLALLRNKYMTNNEVVAFKWNMIVSQFAIPYIDNLDDVLNNISWREIMNSIANVEYHTYGYDNDDYTNGAKEYLTYLQSKSKELQAVLEILNGEKIYTPIYNGLGEIATVEDLVTDDVLYLKDNYALPDSTKQSSNSSNTDVEVAETTSAEEYPGLHNPFAETTTTTVTTTSVGNNSTTETSDNNSSDFISKLEYYYNLLNGEKEDVYTSILSGSSVQEIMIPCYVNTDSTYMYNTLFMHNASRYSADSNGESLDLFYDSYKDYDLYLDSFGNICIKTNYTADYNDSTGYVIVYPSYANPMYISTEISEEDIAGVYYGDYKSILTSSNYTIDNSSKKCYGFSDGVIKTYSEMKEVMNLDNILDETYYGIYANTKNGSFQNNQLLTPNGTSVIDYKLGRYNSKNKDNLNYAKIDTTSNFIGNFPLLTMLNSPAIMKRDYSVANNCTGITQSYDVNLRKYSFGVDTSTSGSTFNTAKVMGVSSDFNAITSGYFHNNDWTENDYIANVSRFNVASGQLAIEKYNFTVLLGTSNTSLNSYNVDDSNSLSNGNFYIKPLYTMVSGGKIANKSSQLLYNGNSVTYNSSNFDFNTGSYTAIERFLYPYLTAFEATKGNFLLPGLTGLENTYHKNSISNLRGIIGSVSSVADHNNSGIYAGENIWLMSMIDAEKYSTTFKLAYDTDRLKTAGIGGSVQSILGGNVNDNKYLNPYIPHGDIILNAQNTSQVLDWVIDDASGWGAWGGSVDEANAIRGSLITGGNSGLLQIVNSKDYKSSDSTDYSWYMVPNSVIVSPYYYNYSPSDIINIAYLWDRYYINQSPLVNKFEVKSVDGSKFYSGKTADIVKNNPTVGDSEESVPEETDISEEVTEETETSSEIDTASLLFGELRVYAADDEDEEYIPDVALTPYNIVSDTNNNNLYYTRTSIISNQLISYNSYTSDTLSKSEVAASVPVYSVHYNVPLLMISTYKNGYGDNLARWVDNLGDDSSKARYMMDLISQFLKYPITGIRNFTIGTLQFIHCTVSKSSRGSILNLTVITDYLTNTKLFNFYLILQGILTSFLILRVLIKYTMERKKFPFYKLGRVFMIGFIPVILLYSFSNLITSVNSNLLSDVKGKIMLTDLENKLNPTPKQLYGRDDEILVDSITYNSEDATYLTVSFKNPDNTTVKVTLDQLYNSILYNSNSESSCINDRLNMLWYRSDMFVPVNYERYGNSIFYYFYDYLRYQYMGYSRLNGSDMSTYDVETITDIDEYYNSLVTSEEEYLKTKGIFIKQYTDMNYTMVNDGVNDLIGLSNLFTLVDNSGNTVSGYDENYTMDTVVSKYLQNSFTETQTHENFIWPFAYFYTSSYMDNYKSSLYSSKDTINNMTRWQFNPSNIPTNEGRAVNRVYGSISKLKLDSPTSSPTKLEVLLNKVNEAVYDDIYKLTELYDDKIITDDVYIFISALYATFEFNNIIGGGVSPTSLDNSSLSSDKLFKTMYSKDIKEATGDDNIFYVVYRQHGFLTAIIVFLTEIVLVFTMYVASAILVLIFISTFISFAIMDNTKFKTVLLRVLSYYGIILIFQVILDCVINWSYSIISISSSRFTIGFVSFLSFVCCVALLIWAVKTFVGLAKNMTTFGSDTVAELMTTFINKFSTGLYKARHNYFVVKEVALTRDINLVKSNQSNSNNENSTRDSIQEIRRKFNLGKKKK